MKRLLIVPLLILAASSPAQNISISERLKSADTVLLISHDFTSNTRSVVIVDSAGKAVNQPSLVLNDKLNEEVVKERKVLSKQAISSLSNLLSCKYKPTKNVITSGCFDPHHAIIIISKGKTSYIDLCFQCWNYITSAQLTDVEIGDDKMENLYNYFKEHGFTYKIKLGD